MALGNGPAHWAHARTSLGVVVALKQVPLTGTVEQLTADGRLVRDPHAGEINPWCRRAITAGLRLADQLGEPCTAISVGPPAAERALREAKAAGVDATILVTDPTLAGSDALATARVLATAIRARGGAGAVVAGHESVDGATGVVPAMLAELLGMSCMGPYIEVGAPDERDCHTWLPGLVKGGAESATAAVRLPAVITVAERSGRPTKVPWEIAQHAEPPERLCVAELPELGDAVGQHSWTEVNAVVTHPVLRRAQVLAFGAQAEQALRAALSEPAPNWVAVPAEPIEVARNDRVVLVLARQSSSDTDRLVALARRLTAGPVLLVTTDQDALGIGADELVLLSGQGPASVAAALADLVREIDGHDVGVMAAADLWERHVLGRLAARLDAGLLTDLTAVTAAPDTWSRWEGEKSVGGGQHATVESRSRIQLATVRTGFLPAPESVGRPAAKRRAVPVPNEAGLSGDVPGLGGLDSDLSSAEIVIGIGRGVDAADLPLAERLARHLGAELAATRPVTDAGLLPHGRQVGVTGTSISPRVYLGLGISGSARHLHGLTGTGTLIGVTLEPGARLTEHADLTVVGDWRVVARALLATEAPDHSRTRPRAIPATPIREGAAR